MSNDKSPAIPLWQLHSKREKLACLTDYARWKLGLLDKYLNVDYSRVERVIFVCKGNICRSAYAEAKFNMLGSGAISAGTEAKNGRPANSDAIRIAAGRGVDLVRHRTQSISKLQTRKGDLFVCMEGAHAEEVSSAIDMTDKQLLLFGGLWGMPRVSDPYGRTDAYFESIFELVDYGVAQLLSRQGKGLGEALQND